jgi:outer membrane protein OmpA-like peptidoglycan-associated protein
VYYDDYDGFLRARRWKRIGAIAAVLIVLLGAGFGYWKWQLDPGSDSSPDTVASVVADTAIAPVTTTDDSTLPETDPTLVRAPTTSAVSTSTASTSTASTSTATTSPASSTTSAATTTSVAGAPTTVAGDQPLGYPTGPDGLPLPLVVIFDTTTITISGQVPSQAARDRIDALALANSQFPNVQVVDNLVINPAVPISVGVRVIELNSARFPEGSTTILPAHAHELDRVVAIMKALPNISVVVVGHADQRGDDSTNFAVSDQRARAVVNYLFYLGISPTRLSSRAAGESDLLSVGDDAAALALNRRTEFIFFGLLIP